MKKPSKFVVAGLSVGLGLGVWAMQRGASTGRDKEPAAYADAEPGFDLSRTVAGEIVVDFQDGTDRARVDEVGRKLGVSFTPAGADTDRDGIYVAHVPVAEEAADLTALRHESSVEGAEESLVYSIPEAALAPSEEAIPARDTDKDPSRRGFPNDPRFKEQWHMEQIHMPEAWKQSQGAGVVVAVIDTGVSHVEDLADTEFVPGWNFVADNDKTDDDHGHGTHVAGTIAQSTHNGRGVAGVAYRAKIMPLKVLSAQGSGSVAGIAQAVRWAADHGAKVINMSLGGAMNSKVLGDAVKYAHDHGVTVVCAAGNDGRGRVGYPAANKGAVAVAATQKDETTTFYSNWGKQIDVAGPGGNTRGDATGGVLQNTLYQVTDDYFYFMGTSMASPHVAGIAALIVAEGVTEPDAVEAILKETARVPAGMKDKPADYAQHYGAGLVDAAAAVKKAAVGAGEWELGGAGLLAGLALVTLRRRGLLGHFGAGGVVGLVVGASGLFFAHLVPGLGGHFAFDALVTQGFPAWDGALFGLGAHGNPLFYSALVPLAAAVLLYGVRPVRGLVAGFCFGVGGHLLAQAALGTVALHWLPLGGAWLVVNALACLGLGYATARK